MKRLKYAKKVLVIMLAALLCLGQAVPALAAEEEGSGGKEEVVYVNLSAQGDLLNIYVVNIFPGGDVTDYGSYASVKILNTTDEITQNGDEITFSSEAEKVYYQGELVDAQIPWNIEIHYFLNGKEYTPSEIAGQSGALEIDLAITRNVACTGTFYDDYALQVSFTLDTEKCENIEAEDATIANVGSDKQLTYTILPGNGIHTVIRADVADFTMDAVAINGIRMNLSLEIDDEELISQITDLLDAIREVDDGTQSVYDGVEELKAAVEEELVTGTQDLSDGAGELSYGASSLEKGGRIVSEGAGDLSDGADALDAGIAGLNAGIAQVQAGLEALDAQSGNLTDGSAQMRAALSELSAALSGVSSSAEEVQALVEASSDIRQGIEALSSGAGTLRKSASFTAYKLVMKMNGLDIDELVSGNTQAAKSVSDLLALAQQYEGQLKTIGALAGLDIDSYLSLAEQMITLFAGNNAAISGMEAYLDTVGDGIAELADGAEALAAGYEEFDGAVSELADTLTGLLVQMNTLKSAVNTLVEEYAKLDDGLCAYTKGVSQVAAGYLQVADGASSLAEGSAALAEGSGTLSTGTQELLDGIRELYRATGEMQDGTGELSDGVAELLDGILELYDGTGELKDGTGRLRDETDGMDTELEDKIQEILDSITGSEAPLLSFVSEKNTDVASVQFVIQTESIELAEEEAVTEEEEPTTFWQRLIDLFR